MWTFRCVICRRPLCRKDPQPTNECKFDALDGFFSCPKKLLLYIFCLILGKARICFLLKVCVLWLDSTNWLGYWVHRRQKEDERGISNILPTYAFLMPASSRISYGEQLCLCTWLYFKDFPRSFHLCCHLWTETCGWRHECVQLKTENPCGQICQKNSFSAISNAARRFFPTQLSSHMRLCDVKWSIIRVNALCTHVHNGASFLSGASLKYYSFPLFAGQRYPLVYWAVPAPRRGALQGEDQGAGFDKYSLIINN